MKKLKQTLNILATVCITISLASCSGGNGGGSKQQKAEGSNQQQTEGIKQLQTEVNGPFNEYFQVIDNAKKIERGAVEYEKFVQYEFTILIKVKKPFICKEDVRSEQTYIEQKLRIHLKFYGDDKKQLPINGKDDLTFSDIAVKDKGSICDAIGKPKGTETWITLKTIDFKKDSPYFTAYPSSDIKYFTVETGD